MRSALVGALAAAYLGMGSAAAQTAGIAGSVLLRTPQASANVARLPVIRSYDLAALRARPVIALGANQVSLRPLFATPRSLLNLTQRLQAMPQRVRVTVAKAQVLEIAQGLVIHQELAYAILPGQCTTPAGRGVIEAAGIHCPTRIAPAAADAAFAARGDPHYVADPARRAQAVARYRAYYAQADAVVSGHIADFRRALADPGKRARAVASYGAARVAQIAAMSNDQLKDAIASTAATHVRQTLFVPRALGAVPAAIARLGAQPSATGKSAPLQQLVPSATDQDFKPIYLTGFTLANDDEWSDEVDATVDPCAIAVDVATAGLGALLGFSGCPVTASVTPYAELKYAFGLRFPIEADLHYHREVHADRSYRASVTPTFRPINGSASQYAQAGLAPSLVFGGQELVAQLDARAGFRYDLPVVGGSDLSFGVSKNFADALPPPFAGGQFAPPAPGSQGLDGAPIVFDQLDLLGDNANFGFAGAQVFPAVKVGLVSNGLRFDLVDHVRNAKVPVTVSGAPIALAADPGSGFSTRFTFGDPVYNLAFRLTPGIDVHLFVDLLVWSDAWDPQIWFPELAITLPPGGVDFSCHAGTSCTRDYAQTGGGAVSEQSGAAVVRSAMLQYAKVHFHQNGDGKDWDTQVDLMLKDGGGGIVAQSHLGVHTDFANNTTTQDYGIDKVRAISKADLLAHGSFDMVIHPKGNDHWNYTATVTLGWDDGTTSTGSVTNYVDQNYTGRTARFADHFIAR